MERRRSLHCGEHVVETYASPTGPTPLPPLWSLGFRQSRYSYYPESRVIEIADRLHADRRAQTAARDLEQRDAKQPNKPLLITPKLAELPVYVREGSILPIAPLTQSTGETPVGPLTLRVYAGGNCHGDLYQDDGKSFAFRSGQFLRLHFSCEVKPDGTLTVHLTSREGSFAPWWKQVRLEAFGWTPRTRRATSATGNYVLEQSGSSWTRTIPESSAAMDLTLN